MTTTNNSMDGMPEMTATTEMAVTTGIQVKNTRGIYVHVPFCMSKCPYCDFYSIPVGMTAGKRASQTSTAADASGMAAPALIEDFAKALEKEIAYYGARKEYTNKPVESVYFGGGTPCLLGESQFERIMRALRDDFEIMPDAEISMEANPAAVTADKLRAFCDMGLNRLSIGAQSFDRDVLRTLGRLHSAGQIAETVDAARAAGLENISLDLMFGISGQTEKSWEMSVAKAIELAPAHISLYSLEIMDNTRFARDLDKGIYRQTTEDADRLMYAKALEMLDAAGYRQYEISNVSKPGYECRHNLRYWNMGEYIGLGPSAHSFVGGARYSNAADARAYISQASTHGKADGQTHGQADRKPDGRLDGRLDGRPEICGYHKNTREDNISEYLFTGLRRSCGISKADFRERFGEDIWQIYADERAEFDEFVRGGFAFEDEDSIRLSRKGMDISNKIMMIFV